MLKSLKKGHELEEKVEKYFQLNGYQTKRNVVLEGKSGGRHEIDILAEKSDGVTTIKMMVECKAWNKPIDKDVVFKVNYIVKDLGLNKAIIVTLKGYRIGAEKAAKELGIELWDGYELEKKLGKISVAELEIKEFEKIALGFPVLITKKEAHSFISKQSRGFWGMGKEEIRVFNLIWLPCYLLKISCTKTEGVFRRKSTTKPIWNLYESLEGNWFYTFEEIPKIENVKVENTLQPKIKDVEIIKEIQKIFKKSSEVVTFKAQKRYARKLEKKGIHSPLVTDITFDNVTYLLYPFFIAILKRDEKERIIVVDGVIGKINKNIGYVLTTNLNYIIQNLKMLDGN
ncbi:MAG: restriction endonuclease [Candidatus Nealsonbacteria bacterium]